MPQVLRGNPLVQSAPDQELNFGVKRRWDDDVVFKNQDRGAPKKQQRFINDTIRLVQVLTSSAMQLRAHLSVAADKCFRFVTQLLLSCRSDFHKRFMDRYIK